MIDVANRHVSVEHEATSADMLEPNTNNSQ